jgi:hypothetical protein
MLLLLVSWRAWREIFLFARAQKEKVAASSCAAVRRRGSGGEGGCGAYRIVLGAFDGFILPGAIQEFSIQLYF